MLLAQPPKIFFEDLTPYIHRCIFLPSSFIVLGLFDKITSLLKCVEVVSFDVFVPFFRHVILWIHRIQDDHEMVGTFDGLCVILVAEDDGPRKRVI